MRIPLFEERGPSGGSICGSSSAMPISDEKTLEEWGFLNHTSEDLVRKIKGRARDLFLKRQMLCTEAVFTVLNQSLRGGLPSEVALRLASGLTDGLGGNGCLCGAMNGGILGLGLFLGKNKPGLLSGRKIRSRTKLFYKQFVKRAGSTCCRILTREVKQNSEAHFRQCAELTGAAAEIAVRIILGDRPELAEQADWSDLSD